MPYFFLHRFAININNEKVVTNVAANDGKWHHICFSWSNKRGTFKIYRDGLTLDNGDNLATGQTVQGKSPLHLILIRGVQC